MKSGRWGNVARIVWVPFNGMTVLARFPILPEFLMCMKIVFVVWIPMPLVVIVPGSKLY